jgi:hypothetical protein
MSLTAMAPSRPYVDLLFGSKWPLELSRLIWSYGWHLQMGRERDVAIIGGDEPVDIRVWMVWPQTIMPERQYLALAGLPRYKSFAHVRGNGEWFMLEPEDDEVQ